MWGIRSAKALPSHISLSLSSFSATLLRLRSILKCQSEQTWTVSPLLTPPPRLQTQLTSSSSTLLSFIPFCLLYSLFHKHGFIPGYGKHELAQNLTPPSPSGLKARRTAVLLTQRRQRTSLANTLREPLTFPTHDAAFTFWPSLSLPLELPFYLWVPLSVPFKHREQWHPELQPSVLFSCPDQVEQDGDRVQICLTSVLNQTQCITPGHNIIHKQTVPNILYFVIKLQLD